MLWITSKRYFQKVLQHAQNWVSGERSSFLALCPCLLIDQCYVILLGANDAVLPGTSTNQHVPIDQYKSNLDKIVNHPRIQGHKPKILLVTPPPLDEIKHTKLDLEAGLERPIRTSAVSASYSEKAREVARENSETVILVDLWQALMDKAISLTGPGDYKEGGPWLGSPENGGSGGLDKLPPDGLHMDSTAYQVFFGLIRAHIIPQWKNAPEGAGFVLPTWKGVNGVTE